MAARVSKLGDVATFRVEDDEGTHEIECTITSVQPLEVTPTHWLGEAHPILEAFRYDFAEYMKSDPDGPDAEQYAADYITAVTAKLSGDMWAIWKRVMQES